jgi:hypothetical protein
MPAQFHGTTMVVMPAIPQIPEIGHAEGYYSRKVREAEKAGDDHAREAFKVAQYITLAISPHLEWPQKLRYFEHALRRHCNAPPLAADPVWLFYAELANLVRRYCGNEALKLASREDDRYADMLRQGYDRQKIENEAETFFTRLLGNHQEHPIHFNEEDWMQLRMIRDQWI